LGVVKVIVLDTHIIIWDALSPERLSQRAKEAIYHANEGDGIIFCDISLWEIAMLIKKERVRIDIAYQDFINLVLGSNKYIIHRISPEIAELSVNLPASINKDPADRIIAATSIINNAPLVTKDENLTGSTEITVIW
jgi:PIN domain nuclease of toxin-antitoxin system